MLSELEGEAASEVSGAFSEADEVVSPVDTAEGVVKRLTLMTLKEDLKELSSRATAEPDPQKKASIMEEYKDKYERLQKLSKR